MLQLIVWIWRAKHVQALKIFLLCLEQRIVAIVANESTKDGMLRKLSAANWICPRFIASRFGSGGYRDDGDDVDDDVLVASCALCLWMWLCSRGCVLWLCVVIFGLDER